jgi:hypothetical protein
MEMLLLVPPGTDDVMAPEIHTNDKPATVEQLRAIIENLRNQLDIAEGKNVPQSSNDGGVKS